MKSEYKFKVVSSDTEKDLGVYPDGTMRIVYNSGFDGENDWALFYSGNNLKSTVVYLHGSFSQADQLFTRQDIRNFWLKRILAGGHPLLSINMRGTSYMSPAATQDFTDLLNYCREKLHCGKIILLGGSGGASSAMAYACMYPENIDGVIALGMCDIFARLDFARKSANETLQQLAQVTFAAYGGNLEEKNELYQARSVLANIDKLNMPIVLTMGEADSLIPVEESRKIAAAMKNKDNFTYYEIPDGDHDSAIWVDIDLEKFKINGYCPENK